MNNNLFDDIKTGLTEAIEYKKGNIKLMSVGNYNILMRFGVRYALGKGSNAPMTVCRIIGESIDLLYPQTKEGIISDIEDYLDQHEHIPFLTTWEDIVHRIKKDGYENE